MTFYDDTNKITKEAMDNTMRSLSVMTKGFQQIATETSDFAKRSFEEQSAAMERLAQVRTLEKALELQGEYAKSAYQSWINQATRVSEIYADIAKDAYKPLEAIAAKAGDLGTKAVGDTGRTAQKAVDTSQKQAA